MLSIEREGVTPLRPTDRDGKTTPPAGRLLCSGREGKIGALAGGGETGAAEANEPSLGEVGIASRGLEGRPGNTSFLALVSVRWLPVSLSATLPPMVDMFPNDVGGLASCKCRVVSFDGGEGKYTLLIWCLLEPSRSA